MWRGGCIIRSVFLNDIAAAFEASQKPKHLLLAPYFRDEIKELLSGWKHLVAHAMKEELPVPAFSSALNYFYSLVSAKLPANRFRHNAITLVRILSNVLMNFAGNSSMRTGPDMAEIQNQVLIMCSH